MRRLLRPGSRGFRAMLGMALLAWAMLASGVLAAPLYMSGAMQRIAAPQVGPHCDGVSMRMDASHQAPAVPAGHGDCCHEACHCLSACNAVLAVPRPSLVGYPPHELLPMLASAARLTVPAAPPLRPPIA